LGRLGHELKIRKPLMMSNVDSKQYKINILRGAAEFAVEEFLGRANLRVSRGFGLTLFKVFQQKKVSARLRRAVNRSSAHTEVRPPKNSASARNHFRYEARLAQSLRPLNSRPFKRFKMFST
jgi:hypothetical protein